ncbi:DDE-type integrase/transposase/recombinase [Streptococcus dysgalactiae]|uniref:DDE-type integrase/transposase/recombinase n=1 Tax=Streptococcus dysgalactiae TaxID=1334 RepID=UPI003D7A7997
MRLHVDFAGPINGITYLILVDAYSKWPEVVPMTSPTSSQTIMALSRLFSQHGIPEIIVSDNGSQFTSDHFEQYCHRNTIRHIRTPPYHPQSNGQAERFVDTFKRALLKARGEGTTEEILQKFLLVYRTTRNKALENDRSPAEVLMGRKLRTTLDALTPVTRTSDTNGPDTTDESIGRRVYARDYRDGRKRWTEGTITAHRGKVLFDVAVNDGTWIRHQNQLRPRFAADCQLSDEQPDIPLTVLLDTFDLQNAVDTRQIRPQLTNTSPITRRRSHRRRRKPDWIQINPKKDRY